MSKIPDEKTPGQWTVEAVYRGVNGTLIQIAPSGSYEPDEWWPKVGDKLIHQPKEK